MVIDISKETIIDLLKSVKPNYNVADEIPNELGYLSDGGLVNCWCWRDFDESTPYSAGELYGFYLRCKESWNGVPKEKQSPMIVRDRNSTGELVLWYA